MVAMETRKLNPVNFIDSVHSTHIVLLMYHSGYAEPLVP